VAIITISRGTLSGGRAVAECLAETLGYPCVGREILQQAAQALGASEETVRRKLETPPGRLALLTQERQRYLLAVQAALAEHVARGDLVYHGLAGQFLLRGLPGVLRVRLIAPPEMRIRALVAAHHATSQKAAARFIRNVDRDRKRWVRLMYGADVTSPSLYDLTINLRAIALETVCDVVAQLVRQPHYEITHAARGMLESFAAESRERLRALLAGQS
jgi:cytidylate kinase